MIFPEFHFEGEFHTVTKICSAPFGTLKELHIVDNNPLLRYAYKLTVKALNPPNLERIKSLSHCKFLMLVSYKLVTSGKQQCLPYFEDVVQYIKVILRGELS